MKKIAIVGGGSVGLLFSSYLSENFHTTLYTRTEQQAEAIRKDGVIRIDKGMKQNTPVHAEVLPADIKTADFVIIAVKQYHLNHVMSVLKKELRSNVPILFVQNGMGHIHKLKDWTHKHLFLGIVEHGALKTDLNEIHHTGAGVTKVACYRGEESLIEELFIKQVSSFPFQKEDDWHEMLRGKLIVNACINPLTSLYRITNGQLIENDVYYEQLQAVFTEIMYALRMDKEKAAAYWKKVVDICRSTSLNRSSMLRDIEEGRITEIDAIVGFVLQEASMSKVSVPVLQSLYKSIKEIEKGKERLNE